MIEAFEDFDRVVTSTASVWSLPVTTSRNSSPIGSDGLERDVQVVTRRATLFRESEGIGPAATRDVLYGTSIDLMARYCADKEVDLAPHAKTTMSPQLVGRQLDAGAWGVSVANVHQARTLAAFGVNRLLIANEVIDGGGRRWVADQIEEGGAPTILCYVDSVEGVALLDETIRVGHQPVLLEVGHQGGRAGCRSSAEAFAVASAVWKAPNLRLAGMACFEGLLGSEIRTDDGVAQVRQFLDNVRAVAEDIASAGLFTAEEEVVMSAGGSAYFDQVVEAFGGRLGDRETRTVLRSGCYVTHDHGAYEGLTPLKGEADGFRPALRMLATVLSRPEPDLAVMDFGRRDAPYDAGLPVPLTIRSRSTEAVTPADGMTVRALNDQHGFMSLDPAKGNVKVGDRVEFGISHPCTAFDKWRVMPLVDDEDRLIEVIQTYF